MIGVPPQPERLLSVADVADWLQISKPWVTSHSNGNRRPALPSVKMGKSVRFRREAVERFLGECERLGAKGGKRCA
jgi:predicted DNA-binding transcriptional regulator AlpA